ncbi:MAG: alanine--tRNA ligase [Candidatus Kapaibacterium sp.]
MTSNEIRQSFLDFFENKEHKIVPSAPVIPHGDPTLLFTNAGMNQFKDVFLGAGSREYKRAADTQKCIRVSGKHNDLEEVGVDTYHHTFFEMLGNWSFGDYYKEEAIMWAWELLTEVWGLDKNRLHATVFRSDDEAFEIWTKYLPKERIHRFDEKDNFWEMGDTGPCGPCSEIHYDMTKDLSGGKLVNAGVPEVIEIWNLVFIQYNRKSDGTLQELSARHVDTGMGFERICAVIQGKDSNYDTDVFMPLISKIEELSGKKYSKALEDKDSIAMRVISDHVRTLSFAIADGALPGNEGRGYVLRRILRRGSRFARNLGFREPALYKLVQVLIDNMGGQFPEIARQQAAIEKVIMAEEFSFLQTLERGLDKFEDITKSLNGSDLIPGVDVFQLYDTYGFPPDLTALIARERGLKADLAGFEEQMKLQKERSRKARKVQSQEAELPVISAKTEFTGYHSFEEESKVLHVQDNIIILEKTPFYAESGGQIADTGTITLGGETYNVVDVKKSGDAIVHICGRDIEKLIGETALAKVDAKRRKDIMRNHSATHLLHEALRTVLGEHVQQSGSYVAPGYLRFDFNHFDKVSDEELEKIENIVNDKILENIDIDIAEMRLDDARKNPKIKMFFGDKYSEDVRVIAMDKGFSVELCGGTHVNNTAEIGMFKIISESSIAAGVRRVEGITGKAVKEYMKKLEDELKDKDRRAAELDKRVRDLEKQLQNIQVQETGKIIPDLASKAKDVNGIKVTAGVLEVESIDQLRDLAEQLRNSLKESGIGLLGTVSGDKVQLVCVVTDDLKKKLPAGKLVGEAAKRLGGGGGGKPHMATAGGRDKEALPELIESGFYEIVNSASN